MSEPGDWDQLIVEGRARCEVPATALTFLKKLSTASKPVLLSCDDGREYLVKGRQNGRMIVSDRIVGLLGKVLESPVGDVTLVRVPQELIQAQPEMHHMEPGVSHGSVWIPNCTERRGIQHFEDPVNRARFASLAVLYGWVGAVDHQFIYDNSSPNQVYSVDHGHFFPGSTGWSIETLKAAGSPITDRNIMSACGIQSEELEVAFGKLNDMSDSQIASNVAAVPVDWKLSSEESVHLTEFLCERRDALLSAREKST
ncbi:MAG: hypothetical protein O7H41_18340 [Planctomycetota bacterium]|nr:hypothetical protein [Planctomycetota bacterium]